MAEVQRAVRAQGRGPEIEIMKVADANHNIMVDNPLGFVDAVMASCGEGIPQPSDSEVQVFGGQYFAEDRNA